MPSGLGEPQDATSPGEIADLVSELTDLAEDGDPCQQVSAAVRMSALIVSVQAGDLSADEFALLRAEVDAIASDLPTDVADSLEVLAGAFDLPVESGSGSEVETFFERPEVDAAILHLSEWMDRDC